MKFTYKILIVLLILNSFSIGAQTTIIMEEINGVYYVPCEVNGIPMNFIFDTGASNVSISKTEAEFLFKQGLLSKDDFIEVINYRIADGSIKEGLKIKLKEIKIDNIILTDITATIVSESSAPLLLGQSVISKFGRFEIEGNILRIYPNMETIALRNREKDSSKDNKEIKIYKPVVKGYNQELDKRNGFKGLKLGSGIEEFNNYKIINKSNSETTVLWTPPDDSDLNYLFNNEIDLISLNFNENKKLAQIQLKIVVKDKIRGSKAENKYKSIQSKITSVLGDPKLHPSKELLSLWKGDEVKMYLSMKYEGGKMDDDDKFLTLHSINVMILSSKKSSQKNNPTGF